MRDRGKTKIKRASVEGKSKHSVRKNRRRQTRRNVFHFLIFPTPQAKYGGGKLEIPFENKSFLSIFFAFCLFPFQRVEILPIYLGEFIEVNIAVFHAY